jgi:hypothetical protein
VTPREGESTGRGVLSPWAMIAWTVPQLGVMGLAAGDVSVWASDQAGLSSHALQAVALVQMAWAGLLLPVVARSIGTILATLASAGAFVALAGVLANEPWDQTAMTLAWVTGAIGVASGFWQLVPSYGKPVVQLAAVMLLAGWRIIAYMIYDVAESGKSDFARFLYDFLPTSAPSIRNVMILWGLLILSLVLLAFGAKRRRIHRNEDDQVVHTPSRRQ